MNQQIISKIQAIFNDKTIMRVLGCKGTERTLPPPKEMIEGEAPYRRAPVLERKTQRLRVEDQGEEWEQLAQRKLVRSLVPCSINITMFACNHPNAPASMPDSEIQMPAGPQSHVPDGQIHEPGPAAVPPDAHSNQETIMSDAERSSSVPAKAQPMNMPSEAIPTDVQDRNLKVDVQSQQHGSKFLALPGNEKQLLLQMHKNLGHPSHQVLSQVLRPETGIS